MLLIACFHSKQEGKLLRESVTGRIFVQQFHREFSDILNILYQTLYHNKLFKKVTSEGQSSNRMDLYSCCPVSQFTWGHPPGRGAKVGGQRVPASNGGPSLLLTLCRPHSRFCGPGGLRNPSVSHTPGGTWETQSVKRPTSAQVMISQFVSSSPTSGSVLTAQSLEPPSDPVSPSLSVPSPAHVLSLPLSQK